MQTQLADDVPVILGDRVQLQQVILNLIINAAQAMGEVSEGTRDLLISTGRAEPDGVLVAVRDSGRGWRRWFSRACSSPSTRPARLGLGLSICRSIIEAHGGRLWATANVPRGAEFNFTVPAHPGSAS